MKRSRTVPATMTDYSNMTTAGMACYRPERDERAETPAGGRPAGIRRRRLVRAQLPPFRDAHLGRSRVAAVQMDAPDLAGPDRPGHRRRARRLPGLREVRSPLLLSGPAAEEAFVKHHHIDEGNAA